MFPVGGRRNGGGDGGGINSGGYFASNIVALPCDSAGSNISFDVASAVLHILTTSVYLPSFYIRISSL